MVTQHVKIPRERIGVLIGQNGFVKGDLERKSRSIITVDSIDGEVCIESPSDGDPLLALRVAEVVKAIGRGFSPEHACALLDDELLLFEVISLADLSPKTLARTKGRVIGQNGKTRLTLEALTEVKISVYGKTISLLGYADKVRVASEAIEMLVRGAPHSSVYRFLERKRKAEEEQLGW